MSALVDLMRAQYPEGWNPGEGKKAVFESDVEIELRRLHLGSESQFEWHDWALVASVSAMETCRRLCRGIRSKDCR